MAIVKNVMIKPLLFIMDFQNSYKFSPRRKFYDLQDFDNETTTLLIFFEIYTEMHFVSLVFVNERNITTSF